MSQRAKHNNEVFRRLWDKYATLYDFQLDSALACSTQEGLEAEGHASPDRVPPPDLAALVAYGNR